MLFFISEHVSPPRNYFLAKPLRWAEAPCTSAVAAARDFVADVGERVAARSGGLLEVAHCSLENSERDCRRVLVNKFGLALKVRRSHLKSLPHIPMLKIRDWYDFFLRNSCMHILHGLQQPHPVRERAILSAFWQRFRKLHPQHQVFEQASQGKIDLEHAVPLLLHGDEGRGRRHVAHFVLSFHSMLGRGFGKMANQEHTWAKMECNFEGHTFTNRFLIATLRKKDYSEEQKEVWNTLMQEVAVDAGSMWKHPVSSGASLTYWGIVLGITGDWPFLHKSGNFSRSFNNIQKRTTVKKEPAGICHLCRGGQTGYSFEQVGTRRPAWLQTAFTQSPFLEPSPFVENLLHEPGKGSALWCFDWFHTMQLGVLKHYLGSVLALLSEQESAGNIDDRFSALSQGYKDWCHQNSRRAFVSKLSKETIGWDTTSQYPKGTWHKGALSTVLMEFVEFRFANESFNDEPVLKMAAEACTAIQRMGRILYRSSLWLDSETCRLCADLGLQFLRRYAQMASLSQSNGRCLFIYQPKIHVLHHFTVELWGAHERNVHAINPLAKSCQPSEDFIGRPSRLSRRVTAQLPVLHRVMDRYLQSSYHHFVQSRFLIRPSG